MSRRIEIPFDNIENAQRYIRLLAETVTEDKQDIENEIARATEQTPPRRLQALRMVEYSLEKLQRYLSISGRTLNDLRSLRRLLLEERSAANRKEVGQATGTASLPEITSAPEQACVAEDPAKATADAVGHCLQRGR